MSDGPRLAQETGEGIMTENSTITTDPLWLAMEKEILGL